MSQSQHVVVTEVGPRDGLQNECAVICTQDKVRLVDQLSNTGLTEIEVSAFVRPDRVPQLADASDVFASIERRPGVIYSALVPNERGLDRAIASQVDKISLFAAASESFSQANTNASIAETLHRFEPVVDRCNQLSMPVRVYISCAVACPYEGPVSVEAVASVVESVLALGQVEVDLADTIGVAEPDDIRRLLEKIAVLDPIERLALHLHDTKGSALACAQAGLELGVRKFDGAMGGLGGCPFAPGAPGNLATESLLQRCNELGFATGVDVTEVAGIGVQARDMLSSEEDP